MRKRIVFTPLLLQVIQQHLQKSESFKELCTLLGYDTTNFTVIAVQDPNIDCIIEIYCNQHNLHNYDFMCTTYLNGDVRLHYANDSVNRGGKTWLVSCDYTPKDGIDYIIELFKLLEFDAPEEYVQLLLLEDPTILGDFSKTD